MEVIADVSSEHGAAAALDDVGAVLSPILDMASFLLAAPVRLGQIQVVDITPPLTVGDMREMQIHSSAPFDRNARGVSMQALAGLSSLALPLTVPLIAARAAAALRWFVKSLSTDVLHDEFIFLWIALEVLCDLSGAKVTGPYICPNGHAIPECPECRASTTKEVRGPSLRAFLEESGGVDAATGKELWRMRQMMHGAIDFELAEARPVAGAGSDLARRRRRTAQGSTRHSSRLRPDRAAGRADDSPVRSGWRHSSADRGRCPEPRRADHTVEMSGLDGVPRSPY